MSTKTVRRIFNLVYVSAAIATVACFVAGAVTIAKWVGKEFE